jgi:hypothetical protein
VSFSRHLPTFVWVGIGGRFREKVFSAENHIKFTSNIHFTCHNSNRFDKLVESKDPIQCTEIDADIGIMVREKTLPPYSQISDLA